jgi:hypothetical protein
MRDHEGLMVPMTDRGHPSGSMPGVTRRRFVGLAAAAVAAAPLEAATQSTPEAGQPVATPAAEVLINVEQLATVSEALVGGGTLREAALESLAGLISADPRRVSAFAELVALDDPASEEALGTMPRGVRQLADDIVHFWYLGYFDGKPVENRSELYFGLPVWGTLPYVTQPTTCKAYGYWASDVTLD